MGKLLLLFSMLQKYGPVLVQIFTEVSDLLVKKQAANLKSAVSPDELKKKATAIAEQLADFIHCCDCSVEECCKQEVASTSQVP